MHDYLRAVGFSKVQHKRDLQRLLDMVMGSPDSEFASSCGGGLPYAEKCRDFVSNAGITVRGEVDEHGMFSYEYYFPHYTGHQISLTDDISVEKISEREEYDGLCDVVNLGVSLIFHMNHLMDYADMDPKESQDFISIGEIVGIVYFRKGHSACNEERFGAIEASS